MTVTKPKKGSLLADPDVQRWIKSPERFLASFNGKKLIVGRKSYKVKLRNLG